MSKHEKNSDIQNEWLAERFEVHRTHLRSVAYRMLGSLSEADDAVQESWFRLSRTDTTDVENLGGWLTTVVGRICLDMLRSRESRHEEPLEESSSEPGMPGEGAIDPEEEVLLADSVGVALLVVLDTLTPAERLAFVLHDIFALPFDEIAPIVERSPTATRQLASRARRRLQGARRVTEADRAFQREVVDAFLAASRNGDFEALLSVLDPDVLFRADPTFRKLGASKEVRGATLVAKQFMRRAQGARPALVNGSVGLIVAPGGRLLFVFDFTIRHGRIVKIEAIADPTSLRQLPLSVLSD